MEENREQTTLSEDELKIKTEAAHRKFVEVAAAKAPKSARAAVTKQMEEMIKPVSLEETEQMTDVVAKRGIFGLAMLAKKQKKQ